jgi:aminopeptidase N/puromycin-sensitive aminopeptidase
MQNLIRVLTLIFVAGCSLAQRLPQNVAPEHYQLTFAPNLNTEKFSGDEIIQVSLLQASNSITLNAADIEFQKVTIQSGQMAQPARVTTDPANQRATFTVEKILAAGPASIQVRYTGVLNGQLRGFYLSRANGRKYAVTQLESTDARRAFPSFDEPAFKATFDISAIIDKNDTAISNGKIISDAPGPGAAKHTLKFATTPKMSTYLVALAVGDFRCLEGGADGIPIRVCATPDKTEQGKLALGDAQEVLHYYDNYYGIKYPFGKLDLVSVPDFEAGAMENTAAIFYRESDLLADDKNASDRTRKEIALVTAHEMAHQWFGDLVTMQWWNDVWLNEGFATWMESKAPEALHPEWGFTLDDVQDTDRAMKLDALANARPIRAPASTIHQIDELFDGIAYQKTGAVLRMIETYTGADLFRKGVNLYLGKHAYGNATAEDFWSALTTASHKPVDKVMPTFVDQPGVPLISVTSACKSKQTEVTLTQQRFYLNSAMMEQPSNALWQVPICLKSPGNGAGVANCLLMTAREQTIRVPGCRPWVFINADARGYYRSAYDAESLGRMGSAIESGLSPVERLSLLVDEWALAQSGRHPIGSYLALVENLGADRNRAILETLSEHLEEISDRLTGDPDRAAYQEFVHALLQPAASELGWKPNSNEDDEHRALRAFVLEALGYAGRDPETLKHAHAVASQYLADPASVDPNLAEMALKLAASDGDQALLNQMIAAAKLNRSPEDYHRLLRNIVFFRQPELVRRTVEFLLSGDVRNQDAAYVLGRQMMTKNAYALPVAWEMVKAHWPEVQAKMTESSGRLIVRGAGSFCDAASRDDVEQFFKQHPVAAADRALTGAIERINNCIAFKSRQETSLAAWLNQREKGNAEPAASSSIQK